MKTIFKNELPPNFKSWLDLLQYAKEVMGELLLEEQMLINVVTECDSIPEKKYYINIDFAKARAYEEIIDNSKNISNHN